MAIAYYRACKFITIIMLIGPLEAVSMSVPRCNLHRVNPVTRELVWTHRMSIAATLDQIAQKKCSSRKSRIHKLLLEVPPFSDHDAVTWKLNLN